MKRRELRYYQGISSLLVAKSLLLASPPTGDDGSKVIAIDRRVTELLQRANMIPTPLPPGDTGPGPGDTGPGPGDTGPGPGTGETG